MSHCGFQLHFLMVCHVEHFQVFCHFLTVLFEDLFYFYLKSRFTYREGYICVCVCVSEVEQTGLQPVFIWSAGIGG